MKNSQFNPGGKHKSFLRFAACRAFGVQIKCCFADPLREREQLKVALGVEIYFLAESLRAFLLSLCCLVLDWNQGETASLAQNLSVWFFSVLIVKL